MFTPILNIELPDENSDDDVWAGILNAGIVSLEAGTTNRVLRGGDTMTGALHLAGASPQAVVRVADGSTTDARIRFQRALTPRWDFSMSANVEPGNGTAGNLTVVQFDDTGTVAFAQAAFLRGERSVRIEGGSVAPFTATTAPLWTRSLVAPTTQLEVSLLRLQRGVSAAPQRSYLDAVTHSPLDNPPTHRIGFFRDDGTVAEATRLAMSFHLASNHLGADPRELLTIWRGGNVTVTVDPVGPLDLVTKRYADSIAGGAYTKAEADGRFVDEAGDTMSGALTLFGDPTSALHAATKQYVDARAFTDAPIDANIYGRQAGGWVVVSGGGGIADAPSNGNLYARRNAAWEVVPAAGGGITQADADIRYLNTTGDTITGQNFYHASASPRFILDAQPGSTAYLRFTRAGVARWWIGMTNSVEPGDGTGNDITFTPTNDAGATGAVALTLSRGTGGLKIGTQSSTVAQPANTGTLWAKQLTAIATQAEVTLLKLHRGDGTNLPNVSWIEHVLGNADTTLPSHRIGFQRVAGSGDGTDRLKMVFQLALGSTGNSLATMLTINRTGAITVTADPVAALDLTTKQYVDARIIVDAANDGGTYARQGLAWAPLAVGWGGLVSGEWTYNTGAVPTTAGQWRVNNATATLATQLSLSGTSTLGFAITPYLAAGVKPGQQVYIQQKGDATRWILYRVESAPATPGDRVDFNVSLLSSGAALPVNGARCIISVLPEALADHDARYVNTAGDTMTGALQLAADPVAPLQPATRQYTDAADALSVLRAGDTMGGALYLSADPIAPMQVVSKQYADQLAARGGRWVDEFAPGGVMDKTGVAETRDIFNAAIVSTSAAGQVLLVGMGDFALIAGGLVYKPNTRIVMTPFTRFIQKYNLNLAIFGQDSLTAPIPGVEIRGNGAILRNPDNALYTTGRAVNLRLTDGVIDDLYIDGHSGAGVCFFLCGDRNRISKIRHKGVATGGGIALHGANYTRVSDCYMECGDDCYQVGGTGAVGNPYFGLSSSFVNFINCHGKTNGCIAMIGLARVGVEPLLTGASITYINFAECGGEAKKGIKILNSLSTGIVGHITFDGFNNDCSADTGAAGIVAIEIGDGDVAGVGGVHHVTFNGGSIRSPYWGALDVIGQNVTGIVFNGFDFGGARNPDVTAHSSVRIDGKAEVTFNACRFQGAVNENALRVGQGPGADARVTLNDPVFYGIRNGFYGFVAHDAASFVATRPRFLELAGQTTARAFALIAGAENVQVLEGDYGGLTIAAKITLPAAANANCRIEKRATLITDVGQTLRAHQSGLLLIGTGIATRNYNLPAVAGGLSFAAVQSGAFPITFTASAGQVIKVGAATSSAGGTIASASAGASVRLIGLDGVTWQAVDFSGTWTAT